MRPFVGCVEVVIVAARITDKKRKKIVADYLELGSYNATAKKNGVSANTVKSIVRKMQDIAKKCEHKKEENTADILTYMEGQRDAVCQLLDKYLLAMGDNAKIKRAGVVQLATALGIIIDKYTTTAQNEQALKKLDEMMDKIGGVI